MGRTVETMFSAEERARVERRALAMARHAARLRKAVADPVRLARLKSVLVTADPLRPFLES